MILLSMWTYCWATRCLRFIMVTRASFHWWPTMLVTAYVTGMKISEWTILDKASFVASVSTRRAAVSATSMWR
ncbi:hypothetical protein C8J57DRAFT_1310692 [Mycena rebaudengoi]|nr:hypothetical protein C8J57DRAFT_1335444 [Mycena rebaudengoi]KAJ7276910.1 hypothetical protein C8J57DRAFT_1310692 [Mycena rebaudengoi]